MDIDKLEDLIRKRRAIDREIREIANTEQKRMGRPPKQEQKEEETVP